MNEPLYVRTDCELLHLDPVDGIYELNWASSLYPVWVRVCEQHFHLAMLGKTWSWRPALWVIRAQEMKESNFGVAVG